MAERLSLPFSGSKLRETRERAGLTRPVLAKKCEEAGCRVSPQHVGRLEDGPWRPRPPLLVALAKALKVQVDDLLDEAS